MSDTSAVVGCGKIVRKGIIAVGGCVFWQEERRCSTWGL